MNQITEAEVYALLEQYPINGTNPTARLCDLQTIGFFVAPQQPSSVPTEHVPAIGQILSVAPVVQEIAFGGLIAKLKNGAVFALDRSAFSKLVNIFPTDNRCSEYELKVTEEGATSVSIRLIRKADRP